MEFIIPTRIIIGKSKKTSYPLNANTFANKHHRQKHNAKMMFYDYIDSLNLYDRKKGPYINPIRLHLRYWSERNATFDMDNVYYGIHKFLADALTNTGVIVDDNYKLLKHGTFQYEGVWKKHMFPGRDHLQGLCHVKS